MINFALQSADGVNKLLVFDFLARVGASKHQVIESFVCESLVERKHDHNVSGNFHAGLK